MVSAPASALSVARKALAAACKQDQATALQEVTKLLTTSNPPPFEPRVPLSFVADERQRQRLRAIEQRAADILPGIKLEDTPVIEVSAANASYGATTPETMFELLNVLYPSNSKAAGSFIDAGSGRGEPTLAAALSNKFILAKGVESEISHHRHALSLQQAYKESKGADCPLEFTNSDMTVPGTFVGGSCVFLNSVLFDAQLCRTLGERLEEDLQVADGAASSTQEDIVVVSMSRRLALPSFDLIDVLSLPANGGELFTFYINRRDGNDSTHSPALSDSSGMRELRRADCFDAVLDMTLESQDEQASKLLLVALAASEPSTRSMCSHQALWDKLFESLHPEANLISRALGSMVLRSMVAHPVGRRTVAKQSELVDGLILGLGDSTLHPAIKANYLDVLDNLLHDSPLEDHCNQLDEIMGRLQGSTDPNITEATFEVVARRRWWGGANVLIEFA